MKVHETTLKKQGSRSTYYKPPHIKDFITDHYGCRLFFELLELMPFKTRYTRSVLVFFF